MNKTVIGFLAFPYVQPMDLIAPWEVLTVFSKLDPFGNKHKVELIIISENGGKVQCSSSLQIDSHCSFNDAPACDYLIIPGGIGRIKESSNPNILEFVKLQYKTCKIIASVCTGAFFLLNAGLLDGKKATTYWQAIPELKHSGKVDVIEDRVVVDNKIITSGGVTSGIELAFELIKQITNKEIAGKVQLLLEYFPTGEVYASEEMVNQLPPYINDTFVKLLPEYIKNQINEK